MTTADSATCVQVASHEAHHASMCRTLGVGFGTVSVVPCGSVRGQTRHALCHLVEEVLILLAPLLTEGRCPAWPCEDVPAERDFTDLRDIIRRTSMTREHYDGLVGCARQLMRGRDYRRTHAAICAALKEQPELSPIQSLDLAAQLDRREE